MERVIHPSILEGYDGMEGRMIPLISTGRYERCKGNSLKRMIILGRKEGGVLLSGRMEGHDLLPGMKDLAIILEGRFLKYV